MKNTLAIVLVEPENPDNIGAVARAMKNMGLRDMRLVRPPAGWKEAGKKMAMSAQDLLQQAKAYEMLEDALSDTGFVIGTTRRKRRFNANWLTFDQALKQIQQRSRKARVAILFGKESKGLDNDSLDQCDWVTAIPSHPDYPSLNLAQAVMVTAFSLYRPQAPQNEGADLGRGGEFSTKKEIQDVLTSLTVALHAMGYPQGKGELADRILHTFYQMIKRTQLLKREAQMLRGLSRRMTEQAKRS